MELDKNIAILASTAIAYVAQNVEDLAEDCSEDIIKQLQVIANSADFALQDFQEEGTNIKAIISAVEYLQIAVEEYQALEREDY